MKVEVLCNYCVARLPANKPGRTRSVTLRIDVSRLALRSINEQPRLANESYSDLEADNGDATDVSSVF